MNFLPLMAGLCLAIGMPPGVDAAAMGPTAVANAGQGHDAALARQLGADERGMRRYVLVILKTGPARVPDGPERDAMFAGHFANMAAWSAAGKLVLAGPFLQDAEGWRGLYVFAVADRDEARALAESDPVVRQGEMVAEYHDWYGTAALMQVPMLHETLVPPASPDPG
ncbi:hypothetical protein E2F46_00375 [Luteimonas aestuarii]|uniref:YCII-related domain-containing protein n=1 Tax=Luteimonas aestuarii TaxID=453837 RepID=A0A4R5U3W1_9GAMM|nr:YciI family protein [Luteimonas aestuarii]TDK28388.1 hypothetical protein E2F46_00375 [Luteimonas aestuarii]